MQVKQNGRDPSAKYTLQGLEDAARVIKTKLAMAKMLETELRPMLTEMREAVLDTLLQRGHTDVTHVKVALGDGAYLDVLPPKLDNPNNVNRLGENDAADMIEDGLDVDASDFSHELEYRIKGDSARWFHEMTKQWVASGVPIPDDIIEIHTSKLSMTGVAKLRGLAAAGNSFARKWLYKLTKSPSIK